MRIHVFGSYYEGDFIAFKIAKRLKTECEHEFVFSKDPTELIYEDNLIIMDAVKDIKKVTVFWNVDDLKESNILSAHDLDLGYFLKLADSMGMKRRLTIIGLPMAGDFDKISEQVMDSLQQLKEKASLP